VTSKDEMSFVSLLPLQEHIPEAEWIPLPVDTEKFKPKKSRREYLAIGYCGKTTDVEREKYLVWDEVQQAADILRKRGIDVVLQPQPTMIPHDQMYEKYWQNIDVWVDRFGLGFYGFSAVEAAACGIPVVCDMPEYYLAGLPDCPFALTTREKVVETLTTANFLNVDWKTAHKNYIFRVHDSAWVATMCWHKYRELV
jgi:hypothetical protein